MKMTIKKEVKSDIISNYAINEKDTGSVEVQVAILSERIKNITEHLKSHKKDHSCRRGLLILVARRRKLLNYLKKESKVRYESLVSKLGLKNTLEN